MKKGVDCHRRIYFVISFVSTLRVDKYQLSLFGSDMEACENLIFSIYTYSNPSDKFGNMIYKYAKAIYGIHEMQEKAMFYWKSHGWFTNLGYRLKIELEIENHTFLMHY